MNPMTRSGNVSTLAGTATIRMTGAPSVAITGSASGIGLALAIALLARGCHVTLSDVDAARLDGVASDLGGGEKLQAVACDVTQRSAVEALWQAAIARSSGLQPAWTQRIGRDGVSRTGQVRDEYCRCSASATRPISSSGKGWSSAKLRLPFGPRIASGAAVAKYSAWLPGRMLQLAR